MPLTTLHCPRTQAEAPLQTLAGPPMQSPSLQMSAVVQGFPSLQLLPVPGLCAQPLAPPHTSSVHTRLSLHSVPSSVLPSQSSSTPLQVSVAGLGASHALRPELPQTRTPPQVPLALLMLQVVEALLLMALGLHPQLPPDGMHQPPPHA